MPELVAVITTVAGAEQARRLAQLCVQQRLAACVQISAIESVYEWQGRLETTPEQRLLCKTTADRAAALEAALRQHHPYELPAIFTLPVSRATGDYADWVAAQTRPSASG